MNFLKSKLKCKSTYFLLGTAVLELISLILYLNFGVSVFIRTLSNVVITLMIAGIIGSLAAIFAPFKIVHVVVYCIQLIACLEFLTSQASYIANVFVGIDGSSLSAAFIVITLFSLASSLLTLVSTIFVKDPLDGLARKDKAKGKIKEDRETA